MVCRVEFHEKLSCKQFREIQKFDKNDQVFMNYAVGNKFK